MNTEKQDPAKRLHHPYSPSKLQPLEACAKYASIDGDSEASRMGTAQHDMADSGQDNPEIPDYKAMAVVECMKFVDERARLYPGHTIIKEQYLPIDNYIVNEPEPYGLNENQRGVWATQQRAFKGTTAGYLDVGIVSHDGKTAEIIDFKFGQVAVETASNNLQGIAYMLGLLRRFPLLETVNVWFVMPHRDEIVGHQFVKADFEAAYLRVRTVVNRAIEANRDPKDFSKATVTSACLFCAHVGRCPKVTEIALKVGKKYAPLQIPESVSTTVFTDPAQIELGLKLAQVIKAWADGYRTGATNKTVDDPHFVPKGYILVGSQKRKVVKPKGLGDFAKQYLPEALRPKVEELYDVSIGALEKLISTAAERGQKEKTVTEFGEKALAAGLIELGQPFAFLRQDNKSKD